MANTQINFSEMTDQEIIDVYALEAHSISFEIEIAEAIERQQTADTNHENAWLEDAADWFEATH